MQSTILKRQKYNVKQRYQQEQKRKEQLDKQEKRQSKRRLQRKLDWLWNETEDFFMKTWGAISTIIRSSWGIFKYFLPILVAICAFSYFGMLGLGWVIKTIPPLKMIFSLLSWALAVDSSSPAKGGISPSMYFTVTASITFTTTATATFTTTATATSTTTATTTAKRTKATTLSRHIEEADFYLDKALADIFSDEQKAQYQDDFIQAHQAARELVDKSFPTVGHKIRELRELQQRAEQQELEKAEELEGAYTSQVDRWYRQWPILEFFWRESNECEKEELRRQLAIVEKEKDDAVRTFCRNYDESIAGLLTDLRGFKMQMLVLSDNIDSVYQGKVGQSQEYEHWKYQWDPRKWVGGYPEQTYLQGQLIAFDRALDLLNTARHHGFEAYYLAHQLFSHQSYTSNDNFSQFEDILFGGD